MEPGICIKCRQPYHGFSRDSLCQDCWHKFNRVHSTDVPAPVTQCKGCGALIHSGSFCDACIFKKRTILQKLSKEFEYPGTASAH